MSRITGNKYFLKQDKALLSITRLENLKIKKVRVIAKLKLIARWMGAGIKSLE